MKDNVLAELEEWINRHSIDNSSNTPDFILVEYIKKCLDNFNDVIKLRDEWMKS